MLECSLLQVINVLPSLQWARQLGFCQDLRDGVHSGVGLMGSFKLHLLISSFTPSNNHNNCLAPWISSPSDYLQTCYCCSSCLLLNRVFSSQCFPWDLVPLHPHPLQWSLVCQYLPSNKRAQPEHCISGTATATVQSICPANKPRSPFQTRSDTWMSSSWKKEHRRKSPTELSPWLLLCVNQVHDGLCFPPACTRNE